MGFEAQHYPRSDLRERPAGNGMVDLEDFSTNLDGVPQIWIGRDVTEHAPHPSYEITTSLYDYLYDLEDYFYELKRTDLQVADEKLVTTLIDPEDFAKIALLNHSESPSSARSSHKRRQKTQRNKTYEIRSAKKRISKEFDRENLHDIERATEKWQYLYNSDDESTDYDSLSLLYDKKQTVEELRFLGEKVVKLSSQFMPDATGLALEVLPTRDFVDGNEALLRAIDNAGYSEGRKHSGISGYLRQSIHLIDADEPISKIVGLELPTPPAYVSLGPLLIKEVVQK